MVWREVYCANLAHAPSCFAWAFLGRAPPNIANAVQEITGVIAANYAMITRSICLSCFKTHMVSEARLSPKWCRAKNYLKQPQHAFAPLMHRAYDKEKWRAMSL